MTVTLQNKAVHVDGRPSFIFSAELMPYRLPACLWRDRLEKLKAACLNTVGIYWAWNFHSPAPGVTDLTSPDRNVERLLEEAAAVGLWVIARPGPYVCNEWDLGGYPHWLLKEDAGDWRNGDPKHLAFCREWYRAINRAISQKQEGRGGPVILYQIENEHRWGDRDFLGGLCDAAREDGIELPLVGNHDGGGFCVADKLTDGTDVYTPAMEFFRWRGWLEGFGRRVGEEKPLMVMEYRCGDHPFWGEAPASPDVPPPHWTLSQDRLFAAVGANVLNHFVGAGGLTPVGFNSDHSTTSYADYAMITPWGDLTERFYEARLLGGCLESFNERFALSRPVNLGWGTENPSVECLARQAQDALFLFPINHSNTVQDFAITLPDGARLPQRGSLRIEPFHTQLLLARTKLSEEVHLLFSPFQVLQFWTTPRESVLIVYGPEEAEGIVQFAIGAREVEIPVRCTSRVSLYSHEKITVYAVSTATAKQTWVVEREGRKIPLFGNLDLVRPDKHPNLPLRAEIGVGRDLWLVVPACVESLSINGNAVPLQAGEGLREAIVALPQPAPPDAILGEPQVILEADWTAFPEKSGAWKAARAYGPNAEVLLSPGDYRWWKEFTLPATGELPEIVEFLGISAAEITVILNGRVLGVYPKQRTAKFVKNESFNAIFDARGILHPGVNSLAVEVHFHGRHNSGQPVYSGLSQPVTLRRLQREEYAIPKWRVSPEDSRKWNTADLDSLPDLDAAHWETVDLSKLNHHRQPIGTHNWHEVRWYRTEIPIPEAARHRPLYLECPPAEEAWAYVEGRCIGRTYAGSATGFDLTEFSGKASVELTLAIRHNWYFFTSGHGLPAAPRLVAFEKMLDADWRLSPGTEGLWRGEDAFCTVKGLTGWEALSGTKDARKLWYRRPVTVRNPDNQIAPLFVELVGWTEHATLYWNGEPVGLYAGVGPETRFHIHEGIVREENELLIALDGYGKPAHIGRIGIGFYSRSLPLQIGL